VSERAPRLRPAHVLGRGAVCALGRGVPALLDGVFAGRCGIVERARSAGWDAPTAVAGEFPPSVFQALGGGEDLAFRSSLTAAHEALAEANVSADARLGFVLVSTKADLRGIVAGDPGDGLGMPGRLAARLSVALGGGPLLGAISCACASGLVALATASRHLHLGTVERVLVLGVDVLHPFVLAGFGSLHALDPQRCRPFDRARRGVSLGESAAALVLGAAPAPDRNLGSLIGHGGANDACHVTGPDRQGAGLALASARAIAAAGLVPNDVDVVHLHGTATAANDATEAIGLAGLFGGRTPPAFGTKGQTGHTLGASGVLETIVTLAALQRAHAPANVGLDDPDVDPGLDLVRTPRTLARARHALKIASGFGGVQAATVVRA
jgi:3-oxoacyl-[acyl-carrier-protein] synthase-1